MNGEFHGPELRTRSSSSEVVPEEELEQMLALLQRMESMAAGLVLLDPTPVSRLREEGIGLSREISRHIQVFDAWFVLRRRQASVGPSPVGMLEREHLILRSAGPELLHLIELVAVDDHGGNRQALGQYWRIVVEALNLHLGDEAELLRAPRSVSTRSPAR